ncbi:unnamed protein product [Cuscuta campestris]|uniref:Small VCP/p97-interacting protein n=1 Tax=Cuscuta campestris TaxID=132261 RepID=A0A484MFD9_9ASTE|nr:unnamed protein product [Cuscuta campestris]
MGCLTCFGCFKGGIIKRKEKGPSVSDKLHPLKAASEDTDKLADSARSRAAEAAQKRQEEFANTPAGKAARAQMEAIAKKSANTNRGEPALKWQMG